MSMSHKFSPLLMSDKPSRIEIGVGVFFMHDRKFETPTTDKSGGLSITTKHKIGKVTYCVIASTSPDATDTLSEKINKLIIRDLQKAET